MYVNNDIDYIAFLKDKECFIFGAGKEGKRVCTAFLNAGIKVMAFCDNYSNEAEWGGVNIVSFEDMKSMFSADSWVIVASTDNAKAMKKQLYENKVFKFIDADIIDYGSGGENHYGRSYFEQQLPVQRKQANYKHQFID